MIALTQLRYALIEALASAEYAYLDDCADRREVAAPKCIYDTPHGWFDPAGVYDADVGDCCFPSLAVFTDRLSRDYRGSFECAQDRTVIVVDVYQCGSANHKITSELEEIGAALERRVLYVAGEQDWAAQSMNANIDFAQGDRRYGRLRLRFDFEAQNPRTYLKICPEKTDLKCVEVTHPSPCT